MSGVRIPPAPPPSVATPTRPPPARRPATVIGALLEDGESGTAYRPSAPQGAFAAPSQQNTARVALSFSNNDTVCDRRSAASLGVVRALGSRRVPDEGSSY